MYRGEEWKKYVKPTETRTVIQGLNFSVVMEREGSISDAIFLSSTKI